MGEGRGEDIHVCTLCSDSLFRNSLHPVPTSYNKKPKAVFIIPLSKENTPEISWGLKLRV